MEAIMLPDIKLKHPSHHIYDAVMWLSVNPNDEYDYKKHPY